MKKTLNGNNANGEIGNALENGNAPAIPFVRQTEIDHTNATKTINWLVNNVSKFDFELAIQRQYVWQDTSKNIQSSMLIYSLIYGMLVPQIVVHRVGEGNDVKYEVIDGKQRSTTIVKFINNEFQLADKTPDVFGHKIAGKYFKDLPNDIQKCITEKPFYMAILSGMTPQEREMMFFLLNNGSALTKMEVTSALASGKVMEGIVSITKHPFFSEEAKIVRLSKNQRKRQEDRELVTQIVSLVSGDEITGFGRDDLREYLLGWKTNHGEINPELVEEIKQLATYINEAVNTFDAKDLQASMKKVHVPIIFYTAKEALKRGIGAEAFGEFIKKFLVTDYKVGGAYGSTCTASPHKIENVKKRCAEMMKGFTKYFQQQKQDAQAS